MSVSVDETLDGIEAAFAAIEAGLGAGDLEAVGVGDRELNAKLALLAALLDEHREPAAAGSLETVAARLARVLERHGELTRHLIGDRDRAADELGGLRSSRRAATHYLDTAASSIP
jgi:hypothetical protein